MYIPAEREQVEIIGRAGVFFVLAVDQELLYAHLISMDDMTQGTEDVPFSALCLHRDIQVATEDGQA